MARMSYVEKALEEMGLSVRRFSAGSHTLGQVDVDDDVSVIFRQDNDGGDSGGGSGGFDCLVCKISKVSQCGDLVCPDVKKNDPNASCADEIKECMELACRGSCRGAGSGGILVMA